jgi:multidrug efflux pump subunit AcrA (membrane-fusion protein)
MKKNKWVLYGIIILSIAAFLVWNNFLKKSDAELVSQIVNIKVEPHMAMAVKKGDIRKIVSTSGYLEPEEEMNLSFKVNGEVMEILVIEGDRVSEGEELMRLDKEQQQLNYLKAKNNYNLIKINGSGGEVEEAELNFEIAKDNLEATTLKAPFSGLIAEIMVKKSNYITTGTKVIYIIDDSNYKIKANVDESDSFEVKVDQEVIVFMDALPEQEFKGKVDKIAHYTKNTNGVVTLPITVQLDQVFREFKPGFSTLLDIVVDKAENKLIVPITAVLNKQGQMVVVRVVDDKPQLAVVKTGISDGVYMAIEEGLAEGENIIINAYKFAGIETGSN